MSAPDRTPKELQQAKESGREAVRLGTIPFSSCPHQDRELATAWEVGYQEEYCRRMTSRPNHSNVKNMTIEELRYAIVYWGDTAGLIPYLSELESRLRSDKADK